MGTLGHYLRTAREARGIDLRDAAQQTRISINYLKALEEEDFAKLPGEVFVKGFLKSYGKFLLLDEAEVMKRFGELRPQAGVAVAPVEKEPAPVVAEQKGRSGFPLEPVLWGAGICIALVLFLFTALPERRRDEQRSHPVVPLASVQTISAPTTSAQPEKLYLEVMALENTWVLVRTDASPQKKAVLKKGESLIWSADERFLISCGSAGSIKLLLNGQELTVNEPRSAVVRDLAIIASGIVSRKGPAEQPKKARPKPQTPASHATTTKPAPPAPPAAVQQPEKPQQSTPPAASIPVPRIEGTPAQ